MATTEGGGGSHRKGMELEKFKRRMIRSVARRIKEKKPDSEVWEDMKKEIGSNCKKLWERMRMLTLKKLKRLLEADDRIDLIGPVARMTLTDWLLFDLVIVHEKIDVIDREKLTGSYQSKVLSNLFSLVQRFEIEGRTGENLAEAWTAATVYYNSKGHQCSPMMLQRRWYQIKELTRHKFYKFWFNYRGNHRQLDAAKLDSPDDLQKAIALKYPEIVTQKFENWEERIESRMVILPDELGVKMRQINLMKASDTTAPDVVLVEPHIEVIDLGANSESEELENESQNDVSEAEPQPLVKIKSEPVDVDENFEVVHEVHISPEKGSEFDEEIERLQMVEENFEENALQDNVDFLESVVIDPEPSINDKEVDTQSNELQNKTESGFSAIDANDIVSFSIVDGEITNVQRNEEAIMIDDEDEELNHNDASTVDDQRTETALISNDDPMVEKEGHVDEESPIDETNDSHVGETVDDSHVGETVDDSHVGETVDSLNGAIAEISSIASAGVKVENMIDVIESNRTDNLDNEQTNGDVPEVLFPIISTVSSAGIKVEKDLAVCNDIVDNNDFSMSNDTAVQGNTVNLDQCDEISEALPVISTVSSEGVKVEMETATIEIEQNSPEGNIVSIEDTNSLEEEKDPSSAKVNDLEALDAIPMDLNFADGGIDFADDGIVYVEEDEDDIITITDPPSKESEKTGEEPKGIGEEDAQENEKEELADKDNATEETKAQKFDLKLLMCPVVYTTKLDAMKVFDDTSQYEQVFNKESIEKIQTLSKPVSKQSVTLSEQVIEQEENNNAGHFNNDQVDDNNDTADVSDDDLFRNESTNDSDSESEIIDDSKRVKQSSYMLQKPKYRSYNPVLLCKNPDFNTRLKKLTVGFFMSARNRMLLQSCMPMTIDMTKAFEDKLINGTLYLKPSPTNSVINIQDDIVITAATLVKPSAVQQSLMSIDDSLESELKKRMAERVRAINLPDISEVRRLNQHLLTAEVTPLRLDYEISQDEVGKTVPVNCIENVKNDINHLLSQQKSKNDSNSDTNIDPVIPERDPSPTVVVGINNPVLRVQSTPPPMVSIPEASPPPQVVSNNTAPRTTNVDDPNIATNSGTTKVRKPTRKTYYPPLAWNQRPHYQNQINQEQFHTDALLTIDTLYKMLGALDPCSKVNEQLPKKKSHKKKILDVYKKNVEKQNEDKTKQDVVIDITDDEVPPVKKPRSKPKFKTIIRTKDKEYCCWCSYRIDFLQSHVCNSIMKRKHRCKPDNCVCCCRELYYTGDLASVVTDAVQSIEQEDQHISQTIEHVVQLVNQPKPTADFSIQIDLDENDSQVESLSDVSSSNNAVLTQTSDKTLDGTSLNSSDDVAAELTPLLPSKSHQVAPIFRVYTGGTSKSNADTTAQSHIKPKIKVKHNNKNDKNKIVNRHNDNTNNIVIRRNANIRSKSHELTNVTPVGILPNPCTCRPTISQVNQGRIEINGSNNCIIHKKQIKESKIVLSKKLVTDENQPFFVGKGKILLTDKKMPNKGKEQPTYPASAISQTDEVQSISLPAGVQIVLLPNQTLTYVIQPDVTLTPEECAILPQFLVAIQQQIDAVGITLPADHPVMKTDEIIDVDVDESTNKPESTVANTQNATDSPELVKSIPPSELVDESSSEEITAPKSKEDFEMEIDSIAKEKRATADEDFETRIDILAAEKKMRKKLVIASGENREASSASAIEKPENQVSEPILEVEGSETRTSNAEVSTENLVPAKDNFEKEPVVSSTDEATNKKSLLSDLMEMSGIMEEDLAPPPLHITTTQEPIVLDTSNFILQRQVPSEVITQRSVIPVPSLSPILPKHNYTAINKNGNFELAAITSFAELKYSCDNNGLFFKLDIETGQLTSINVCIQKFPATAQPNFEKAVIDLTDDPDISITGTTEDESTLPTRSIIALNEPIKTQISTILQKKQRLMERLSNNLKPVNILQSKKHVARILRRNKKLIRGPQFTFKSKHKLDKIEAKIDLVDSDAPMEEEYLVNSSDDASDDEPLIKKAKRMHPVDTAGPSTAPDQTMDKQGEEVPLHEQGPLKQQENLSAHQEPLNDTFNVQDHPREQQQELSSNQPLNVHEHSGEPDQLNVQDTAVEYELNDETQLTEPELAEQLDDYMDQEERSDEEIDDMSQPSIDRPVPTHLVLSGGALNAHNIPLNTPYRTGDGDEDSQDEDCILGF